ncbi:MAG: DNA double-strand break repair nuclease NurA [Chloroflexi bacterium]|nr:DNA double-strand break repair nuclease NurA [Chloroflexota bacterium]
MVSRIRAAESQKEARVDLAVHTFGACVERPEELGAKCEQARGKVPWLLPGIGAGGLPASVPMPAVPRSYVALATDGSHIDVDRHRSAPCYLINIGKVSLSYGNRPYAMLSNYSSLYSDETQIVVPSPDPGLEDVRVAGPVLGAKRAVEECRALAGMTMSLDGDSPAVALLDGSLVLWDLEGQKYPDFVATAFITDGLLKCFGDIDESSKEKHLAFGSYISSPRAVEAVNLLRVALCPSDGFDCDRDCHGMPRSERPCNALSGVQDSAVFSWVLRPGERSAIFVSRSRVVERHYGRHRVCFFYLNVGDEIARIEMPVWAVERRGVTEIMQALIFEQCRLGDGYPVVLAEAHEKAVVTAADREQFWRLVDMEMERRNVRVTGSAKSRSKRRPFV